MSLHKKKPLQMIELSMLIHPSGVPVLPRFVCARSFADIYFLD